MGKTFRRDKQFRPKKNGRIFTKDNSWKKNKKSKSNTTPNESIETDFIDNNQ